MMIHSPAETGSVATLDNWRRSHGGMDVDVARELRELRERYWSMISKSGSVKVLSKNGWSGA